MVRWSNVSLNSLSGGLLVSLLLHGLIVAVLLFELPEPIAEAEPEQEVVSVTIVPPPEPEPAPEPEPEPAPEPEEPAPEPEAEAPAEPDPEPAELAEAPPVPAVPEADGEAEGEGVPIPVFRPVFRFGEEDAGPEVAMDGGAAEAPAEAPPAEDPAVEEVTETPPPEAPAEPDTEAATEPEAEVAEQDLQPDETEPDQPPTDPAPALTMPDDIALPDAELAGDTPGALAETAAETELASLPEDPADAPTAVPEPKPATPPVEVMEAPADTAPAVDNGLPGVRALSSSVDTGHAVATTAMGALPRDIRGSQLCTTELREQLRRAPEPYRVELLPAYRLPGGTVLNVPNAAFRAGGAWYDLSFRCTVDTDALRVTDFSFKVGAPVPRTQWQQRGFPEF